MQRRIPFAFTTSSYEIALEGNLMKTHAPPPPRPRLKTWAKKITGLIAVVSTASALSLAAAPATARVADTSQTHEASGDFIELALLGGNLENIANLSSAYRSRPLDSTPDTQRQPLGAEAFEALSLSIGQINLFGDQGILAVGAVNQFAQTTPTAARGASGAVSNSGAIAVGDEASEFPSNATFDLSEVFGLYAPAVAETLGNIELEFGAISASAEATADRLVNSTDYNIADAKLNFQIPGIAAAGTSLAESAGDIVDGTVSAVSDAFESALSAIDLLNPVLAILGTELDINVEVRSEIRDTINEILSTSYGTDDVSVNIADGTVSVDVNSLLQLNDRSYNADLIDDETATLIAEAVSDALDIVSRQLTDSVQLALNAVELEISVTARQENFGVGAGLEVSVAGTLEEIISGEEDTATIRAYTILAYQEVGITVPANELLTPLGEALETLFFGDDSISDTLVGNITDQLIVPVVALTDPVLEVFSELIGIRVNSLYGVQNETGKLATPNPYTSVGQNHAALEVSLFRSVPSQFARVSLGNTFIRLPDLVDPALTIEPESVEHGEDVEVSGIGFTPGSTVTLTIPGADGDLIIGTATVDDVGNFTATVSTENFPVGAITVTAIDESDRTDSHILTITEPDTGNETGDQDGTPSGDQDGTPSGDQDGTPSGDQDGTPSGDQDGTPSGDQDGTPSGDQDGTPSGDQDGTPSGDQDGTP
ncbi:choice-of-anchor G family protein, partial [Populibacterium corticicola]